MNKIKLFIKFINLKLNKRKVSTSTFINTKPILKTIQPDVRLSYNDTINRLKQLQNDRDRKNTEPSLEISPPNYSC